jgi:hypothetical protein
MALPSVGSDDRRLESMVRDRLIKVALDRIGAARVTLQAEAAGTTVSAYVADLIARGGDQGLANGLAVEQLEMQVLTALLVRTVLAAVKGEEEARSLTERAKMKALEQTRVLLADLRVSGSLG